MKKRYLIIILLILIGVILFTGQALAFVNTFKNFLAQSAYTGTYKTGEQMQPAFINTFAGKIIAIVLGFIGVLFLLLIIYSGFQWLTAGGNEEKVSKAKTRVLNGVIGLAIALCAFILTSALFSYLNEKFLGPKLNNSTEQPSPPPGE